MDQPKPERKNKSHPFSERKRVVELYESGLGCRRIARALDIDASMIRAWLRRYRSYGLDALLPYYEVGGAESREGVRAVRWVTNERQFSSAYGVYATTLEPVASITRRYGLDYQSFMYHLRKYHPNLISQRTQEALARKRAEGVVLGRPEGARNSHYKLDGKEMEIRRLLAKHWSQSSIAQKLGVSKNTLKRWIERNN